MGSLKFRKLEIDWANGEIIVPPPTKLVALVLNRGYQINSFETPSDQELGCCILPLLASM